MKRKDVSQTTDGLRSHSHVDFVRVIYVEKTISTLPKPTPKRCTWQQVISSEHVLNNDFFLKHNTAVAPWWKDVSTRQICSHLSIWIPSYTAVELRERLMWNRNYSFVAFLPHSCAAGRAASKPGLKGNIRTMSWNNNQLILLHYNVWICDEWMSAIGIIAMLAPWSWQLKGWLICFVLNSIVMLYFNWIYIILLLINEHLILYSIGEQWCLTSGAMIGSDKQIKRKQTSM